MAHIVLVEDEPWLGELYRRLLQTVGHNVVWCRDGYEAIDAIDAHPPALIVLDLLLPWANGIQLLHELRAYKDLAEIPVIVCSNALPNQSGRIALKSYGVVGLFDKAIDKPRTLVQLVNEATHHAEF